MFIETNPAPVKAALVMMGKISSGEVRLPLAPMSDDSLAKLRKALEDYGAL
jgi:4-hydroxy-tetrahydrodipicolinate synthase